MAVYGCTFCVIFVNFHCVNNPKNNGINTTITIFKNSAQKSIGTTFPTVTCISDGVSNGAATVSNVAIVMLNATSPPAIKLYKLADVPLGTVPAKTIPAAISGIFLINIKANDERNTYCNKPL